MFTEERKDLYYVISKAGKDGWYLYTAEQCSFGKRLLWTSDLKSALIFSSEEAIESFKSNGLRNLNVNIYRFLKSTLDTSK
jgi:hypothetical protein